MSGPEIKMETSVLRVGESARERAGFDPQIDLVSESALTGESFEDASEALDKVETIQKYRQEVEKYALPSFYKVFEEVTHLNRSSMPTEQKETHMRALVEMAEDRISRFSPRVADLYLSLLVHLKGEEREPKFEVNRNYLTELIEAGDIQVMCSADDPWEMKLNRIKTRFDDYLLGIRSFDKREGAVLDDDVREWRRQELIKAPTQPPSRKKQSKPGVDPMERGKEGERAPAIWFIKPAWGGYYREQSFSVWDEEQKVWTEEDAVYSEIERVQPCGNKDFTKGPIDITLHASVFVNQWVVLPMPYTHGFHKLKVKDHEYRTQKALDQNGDFAFYVEGDASETVEIDVELAPTKKRFVSKPEKVIVPKMPCVLSQETESELKKISESKRGNIARASAIKRHVLKRIKYLAPKDQAEASRFNDAYRTHPNGFAGAVDELKEADCDVANTYFAALCAKLKIPVRHCVGHSVKGKDKNGASAINSGTGHGWSEVWDEINKEWIRMDATPSGDPNLEDDNKSEDSSAPGDYGANEAVVPDDEKLEELRAKLAERKKQLSYTKEERYLSEKGSVELSEARQIVKEINEAERSRMPSGELVVDALAMVFNAIVESRKTTASIYDGPVRRREGGERIANIIRHKIGIMTGDTDPMSREKTDVEEAEEKMLGGFDLFMIGDKSGSMQSTIDSEALWQIQRRAEYLIFSALYKFERKLEVAGLQAQDALSVRTQSISFRGNGSNDIDLDKPLSGFFGAIDKVKMWHSLTNQGGGNGDTAALSYIYEQIKTEIEDNKKRGFKENRLRIVIACSDGGPDDPASVQMLAEKLGELDAVVVGMGLTETAQAVPIIFDTPHSRGDIAYDINDLPALVAKHVVMEAVRLFPQKALDTAMSTLQNFIDKYKKKSR